MTVDMQRRPPYKASICSSCVIFATDFLQGVTLSPTASGFFFIEVIVLYCYLALSLIRR